MEIDPASFKESLNNLALFSLPNQIIFKQALIYSHMMDQPMFDLIVSNPPFFSEDTQSPDVRRAPSSQRIHFGYD